ncbi:MAG: tetratricopeptide repeat protein, partial [Candidatus Rokubacteria bacterium]|nr:tetratricopeptide repeat protein [Candidatus Rokubacteria bacterium]
MTIARWRLALFVALVLALLALSMPTATDLGWGYLARHDYARARASFTGRLRGDATDRDAWLGLAAAYEALGDPARQIRTLEALARLPAGRRDALERLADVYEWNKDVAASVGALERLLVAGVDAATASGVRQRLLNLYAWAGRYDDIARTLSALVAAPPASADAVEDAIVAARLLGRRRDVIAFATAWAEANPRSIDAARRLAYLHEAVGVPALARDRWLKIARLDPFDGEARERLGAEGRAIWDTAVAAIERTRAEKPRDAAVRRRLVALYREVGEGRRAIEIQRELAALLPDDRNEQLLLARLLVEHDRAAEAIPLFETLVARADGADLFDDLARLYEWTGQPARALALLERLAAARPDDRELAERLLTATQAKGDVAGALALLDRLAARYPAEPRWAERAVDLLIGAGRLADAIPRQQRLVEARAGSLPDALKLAQLYEWTNQPAQALALLERVAAARPADRALGERVAVLARGVGDLPRALAALERLAAQFPAEPRYAEQTVELLLAENRLADAIARQRRLAEQDNPAALLRLAELQTAAGQEREAI